MKKIALIFMAAVIAFTSTYAVTLPNEEADAAVLSKLAGKVLKKLTKEVVQDSAVNMATNYAVNEANDILDKYAKKQGYTLTKVGSKPYYVKSEITDLDRQAIVKEAEMIIEAETLPGGKSAQKWAKLFDWFLPIFAVGVVVNMLDHTINDGELTAWFSDMAKQILIKLGLLQPATPMPDGVPSEDVITVPEDGDIEAPTVPKIITKSFVIQEGQPMPSIGITTFPMDIGTKVIDRITYVNPAINEVVPNMTVYDSRGNFRSDDEPSKRMGDTVGMAVHTFDSNDGAGTYKIRFNSTYYFNSGTVITSDKSDSSATVNSATSRLSMGFVSNNNIAQTTIYRHVTVIPPDYPYEIPQFVPQEMPLEQTVEAEPIDHSNYRTTTGIVMPPAESLTYRDIKTGEPLIAKPDPDGDTIFTRPDGTPVPEDDIDVDDPDITKNPDRSITYTPNPSESNPNPKETTVPIPNPAPMPGGEPIPGTEPGGDDGTVPPGSEQQPPEEFTPGPACAASIQIPKFSILASTFTNAFPFSLPWDLKRAFTALFEQVGDERPGFDFKYRWNGEENVQRIEIPAIFDKWKPFTDSLLLFLFDILIFLGMLKLVRGLNN